MAPLILLLNFLLFKGDISAVQAISLGLTGLFAFIMLHRTLKKSAFNYGEQPSLFVNIMENLTDPLFFLDINSNIIMANKSATDMYGTEIINHNITDFLIDVEAVNAIKKAIESGKSDTVEFSTPRPRSRNYLLRIHVLDKTAMDTPSLKTEERTILLTIYDITGIREAERMRVDFVANVSHELRTPLASILGFVETLQGPAKDDKQALERFLKIMQDEAMRMARLIDDLLSLSHIERDAHIPPSENISLIKIIENVVETMNIRLNKRNMTATLTTEFKSGNITGDRDQLTQVFQNLIDNAVKYGAENTDISIHMQGHQNKQNNQKYIEISITNLGAGIAPEHIKRLTERFYRVDTARSRSLGGTGLGLAIVKHIIQRHEGELSFESEVGKYTKATILLPQKS
ncbi:MAG: GHKL domain-containing protein [Emcibacteraceae bacterium]|nr:GHKL domain-containing protein [Emcibacteraceae bacterium]